ncbi:MAG TPA: GNAT family N-acetyltransferase [Myxococcota bacterium]|nr:GNAT family N-acetyltransferase [Myxococcota bacterium]
MGVTLRPIVPADLEQLWLLDQDPEVMLHITGGQPSSRALSEALLQRMLAAATRGV